MKQIDIIKRRKAKKIKEEKLMEELIKTAKLIFNHGSRITNVTITATIQNIFDDKTKVHGYTWSRKDLMEPSNKPEESKNINNQKEVN